MASRTRIYHVVALLVAGRVGWAVYEFVLRHYGPGTVQGPLLNASPQASISARIAWLLTTVTLTLLGVLLVRLFQGSAS